MEVKLRITDLGRLLSVLHNIDIALEHSRCSVIISNEKHIKAMFLPPNTTAVVQPWIEGGGV